MTKLSVNINKIATIRNARDNNPNLIQMAKDIQSYGANGITIHPRQTKDTLHTLMRELFQML